jgi:hypothetical protein
MTSGAGSRHRRGESARLGQIRHDFKVRTGALEVLDPFGAYFRVVKPEFAQARELGVKRTSQSQRVGLSCQGRFPKFLVS